MKARVSNRINSVRITSPAGVFSAMDMLMNRKNVTFIFPPSEARMTPRYMREKAWMNQEVKRPFEQLVKSEVFTNTGIVAPKIQAMFWQVIRPRALDDKMAASRLVAKELVQLMKSHPSFMKKLGSTEPNQAALLLLDRIGENCARLYHAGNNVIKGIPKEKLAPEKRYLLTRDEIVRINAKDAMAATIQSYFTPLELIKHNLEAKKE